MPRREANGAAGCCSLRLDALAELVIQSVQPTRFSLIALLRRPLGTVLAVFIAYLPRYESDVHRGAGLLNASSSASVSDIFCIQCFLRCIT